MATTVQQILTAAYAKSNKNRPASLATDATELLQTVNRAIRGLYSFASRINLTFFASTSDVPYAIGWQRPPSAESVFRIEMPDSSEVVVVPFDDRKAEPTKPAVYEMGQFFWSAGGGADPVSEVLKFYYARRPFSPTLLTDPVEAQWPESFDELLILEVAIYLAIKDGRMDEVATFRPERDHWATLFTAFLEHATVNERRRFGNVRRYNTNSIVPLKALLAGGS